MQTLARIARLSGVSVQTEPRISLGDEGSRTDGQFFFSSLTAHVDMCVVHPSAPSYLKMAIELFSKGKEIKTPLLAFCSNFRSTLLPPSI